VGRRGEFKDFYYMFIGEYQHSLDDKGRLAIPYKFRALLKKGCIIAKGLDGCLFLYTKTEWQSLAQELAKRTFNRANNRTISRYFLASATDLKFDTQGRVTISNYLRKFANLKKTVIIVGLYDRLEIWDEMAWNKYKAQTEKQTETIAETLDHLNNQ